MWKMLKAFKDKDILRSFDPCLCEEDGEVSSSPKVIKLYKQDS